jgi:hypothetical protein
MFDVVFAGGEALEETAQDTLRGPLRGIDEQYQ